MSIDILRSSAYETTWDMTFSNSKDPAVLQSFWSLFPSHDYVEELELSRLHRIVLGVISWDLTEELGVSTVSEINTVDVRGRSALSLAVIKGDHGAVKMLLESGADVNICDHDGDTALLNAAERHDTTCMGLLLSANANKAHRNKVGRDPMLKALRNKEEDNPGFIQYLLDEGFSMDSKGYNGVTALATATTCNHWNSVKILIAIGADVESADDDGDTPLMESLFFHSDDSLKLLLEAGADYTKIDSYGDPILHDVAIYGGLRTVEIIHASKLDGRNIKPTNKQGKTALEVAQARDMKPEGFVEAFQLMLDGIFAPKLSRPKQCGGVGNELNMVQQIDDDVNDLSEEFFEALEDQCQDTAAEEGR